METFQAIDVHAHYGEYRGAPLPILDRFMTGDPEVVLSRARAADTRLTFCSPLLGLLPRRGADPVAGNEQSRRLIPGRVGLRYWAIIDPLKPQTFVQAEECLRDPWCVGIKIHPEEHGYPIVEQVRLIFEFAARHHAIVQSHSGEPNSLPAAFVSFADEFSEVRLILSHLGCGFDDDPTHQVRAILASHRGNIYTDTSSAKSVVPHLIEWAVDEIGAERLLYGTDSPLYFAPAQRARIDHAEISDHQKRLILSDNAERLFSERLAMTQGTAAAHPSRP
jgi:hypothetical protein